MRSLLTVGVLLAAIAGGMVGVWPIPPASAATTNVSVEDNSYAPPSVTVNVGDTVHWTWSGVNQHTVTATDSSFNSGAPQTTGTFDHTFNTPGTFTYFCQVHGAQVMSGTVVVQQPAAAPTSTSQPAPSATSAPASTSTVAAAPSATVAAGSTPRAASSPTVPAQVSVAPAAPASTGGAGGAAAGSQLPRAGTGTPDGGSSLANVLAVGLGLVGAASIAFAVVTRRRAWRRGRPPRTA